MPSIKFYKQINTSSILSIFIYIWTSQKTSYYDNILMFYKISIYYQIFKLLLN